MKINLSIEFEGEETALIVNQLFDSHYEKYKMPEGTLEEEKEE